MGGLNFPSLDTAIAGFENVNPAYNNPGGIQAGSFAAKYGAVGSFGQNLAVFPTPEAGAAALDANVTRYSNQGKTLQEMINAWSPGLAPGNTPAGTQSYLDYVSGKLGVTPTTPLSQLGPGGTAPFVPSAKSTFLQNFLNGIIPGSGTLAGAGAAVISGQTPTIMGFSVSRVVAGILGFMFIFAGLAALAFAGVGKAADVVLGGHERVRRVTRAAAVIS